MIRLPLALLWVVMLAAPALALESSGALERELRAAGRAEATVSYLVATPTGAVRTVHGRLALELPGQVRLDVTSTGEKIVARADGGEWLQPSLHQLVRFKAQQSAAALRWWRVLLGEDRTVRERRIGPGRYVVTMFNASGAPIDSAEVVLGTRGLPVRLVTPPGEADAQVYRLEAWHFSRPRGAANFRLSAPTGFESVTLP